MEGPTEATSNESIGANYHMPGMPTGMLEGDWIAVTPDGNRIGVVRGNMCFMDGGEKNNASWEVYGDYDLIRGSCENFELFTGWGVLKIQNVEGRNNLSIKAAVDQESECGGAIDE